MTYIATLVWGWLLGALLLGFAIGWIAVVHRGASLSNAALAQSATIIAVLIAISLAQLIPGRAGYWFDLGLVMFAVYLAGCAAGSWLRQMVISRQMNSA